MRIEVASSPNTHRVFVFHVTEIQQHDVRVSLPVAERNIFIQRNTIQKDILPFTFEWIFVGGYWRHENLHSIARIAPDGRQTDCIDAILLRVFNF